MIASAFAGGVATGIYGRMVYLVWPRWEKFFNPLNPGPGENYAEEAAFLTGVAVFLVTTFACVLCLRQGKMGGDDLR